MAKKPKVNSAASPTTPMPWWGDRGLAPHLRWPGVTIEIPCEWNAKNRRWESPDGKYHFDQELADRPTEFFPQYLSHHIGHYANTPFELLDFQKMLIVRPLFGWVNSSTGARRFRFVLAFLPKGNGKSPLGGGLAIFLAGCDGEEAAEVYILAGDKDQAHVVFDSCTAMVEESEDLSELCSLTRDAIQFPATRSSLKAVSRDAPGKHGRRPHGVIIDEFHNQKNRDLYETMRKSMAKRRQPVMICLSHAGDDDESICYEEYEYGKSVIKDPSFDEAYLPVIFEATEKDDWTDPAVHRKANPAYAELINHDIFQGECRAAMNEPRKKNDFLKFSLNRWTNQAVAWLPVEWWDACWPLDESKLQDLTCCAGLDLAQKIDVAAFIILFRERLTDEQEVEVVDEAGKKIKISLNYKLHLLSRFWIPEDTMRERIRVDKVPYDQWHENGWVKPTPGGVIDYDIIVEDIVALTKQFPLLKQAQIGYDPAFATDIAQNLTAEGLTCVEILQNYKYMNEPCQIFEALLKNGRIVRDPNRCMRNHIENVAVRRDDAGRIRPVKPKKASKHVDGVVAAQMALNRLLSMPDIKKKKRLLGAYV